MSHKWWATQELNLHDYSNRGILSNYTLIGLSHNHILMNLGLGRSCLLLRKLISQVVSTPSKDLSLAWLALTVPYLLSRIQPIIRYRFLYKGDSLYSFPLRLPIPPVAHINLSMCLRFRHTRIL